MLFKNSRGQLTHKCPGRRSRSPTEHPVFTLSEAPVRACIDDARHMLLWSKCKFYAAAFL